jgi:hypothetical protein
MTSSELETATFWLVASCPNQLRYRDPQAGTQLIAQIGCHVPLLRYTHMLGEGWPLNRPEAGYLLLKQGKVSAL